MFTSTRVTLKKHFVNTVYLMTLTASAFAADFSGVYQCNGFDAQDGKYTATITLKANPGYNRPGSTYRTYDFFMKVPGYAYTWTGYGIANGSNLAIYFESTGPDKEPSDKGVGIATVVTDFDSNGNEVVGLHKFYYENAYKGKRDYGTEDCRLVKPADKKQ